jgi:hypothetical protein
VLAGVHVDDGHRLRAVDDDVAAGRQPHLAVERLVHLLGHVALVHQRQRALVQVDALEQVGRHRRQVPAHQVVDAL